MYKNRETGQSRVVPRRFSFRQTFRGAYGPSQSSVAAAGFPPAPISPTRRPDKLPDVLTEAGIGTMEGGPERAFWVKHPLLDESPALGSRFFVHYHYWVYFAMRLAGYRVSVYSIWGNISFYRQNFRIFLIYMYVLSV